MSKIKVNSTHGGRGPQPQTFERWVLAAARRGAKRFRVHLADGSQKLVAHKSAVDSAKRMTAMAPVKAEAIDDKDAEIGEWTFPEVEGEEPEVPGYLKEEDDTEPERLLKTFAHLLADAHRLSSKQLVEVVSIQSKHFSEERRNLLSQQLANERLMAKRLRLPARLRIAEGEGEGEEETEPEETENDNFLTELLTPLIKRVVASKMADGVAAVANGTTTKEKGSS
jgi:hypothetical protein